MKKSIIFSLIILLTTYSKFSLNSPIKMNKFIENMKKILKSENREYEEELLNHSLDQYFKEALKKNPTPILEIEEAKKFLEQFKNKMEEELLNLYNIDLTDTEYISQMKKNPKKYGLTFRAYKILIE